MRARGIKPEFWRDERMGRLPDAVRLFYIGLWQQADDAGWFRVRPAEIAADLYPYRDAKRREQQVRDWIAELAELGRVVVLPCDHAYIPSFAKHQRFGGTVAHTTKKEHEAQCGPSAEVRGGTRSDAEDAAAPLSAELRGATSLARGKDGTSLDGTSLDETRPRVQRTRSNGAEQVGTTLADSLLKAGVNEKLIRAKKPEAGSADQ